MNIPYGTCHCGCGEKTKVNEKNDAHNGWVKGEPRRYVAGHNSRLSPHEWLPEDHGHETPCWIWQRAINEHGYGRMGNGALAYRVMWERVHGPVPEDKVLDHLCRVPACCNPDHLEPVSQAENCRRGAKAKLTMEDAREIRRLQGVRDALDLAAEYGVVRQTIYAIWKNTRWREAAPSR